MTKRFVRDGASNTALPAVSFRNTRHLLVANTNSAVVNVQFYFFLQRHKSAAGVPSQASASVAPTKFLVAVGSGGYIVLRPPEGEGNEHFMAMDIGDLLEAVAGSARFSEQMKGLPVGSRMVTAVKSAANDEPSAADLTHQKELKGATTLHFLLDGVAGNVFVRIQGGAQDVAGEPYSLRRYDLHRAL